MPFARSGNRSPRDALRKHILGRLSVGDLAVERRLRKIGDNDFHGADVVLLARDIRAFAEV